MHAAIDFVSGVDLPGELAEEEVVVLDGCRLCYAACTPTAGLCHHCLDRLPRVVGCGLGLAVVVSRDLGHLIICSDCRDDLDRIAELVWVAAMEREGRSACSRS